MMLIMPIAVPAGISLFHVFSYEYDLVIKDIVYAVAFAVVLGILHFPFGCAPFIVSFVLAKKLKDKAALGILLVSTVACSIWYIYWWEAAMWSSGGIIVFFGFAAILSLPVMLPAWITALILNWRYTKNQEPQV